MSFTIGPIAGTPAQIVAATDGAKAAGALEHRSFLNVKELIRAFCYDIAQFNDPLVLLEARGFVTSDGAAELVLSIKKLPRTL